MARTSTETRPPDERPAPPARAAGAQPDTGPAGRYNANLQLIRRRLADDPRQPPKPRPWWRFGS